ncbi:MAG: VCBS repeat-containing protein [Phycisphaerales bacterium]|nr:VCBS repeat-containing protein [Phycisphaerales bacterium]
MAATLQSHAAKRIGNSMAALVFGAVIAGPALGQGGLPYTIEPPQDSVDFGRSVASGGDIDGDGLPDIFVSDPAYANQNGVVGRWFVFSGADGSMIWSVTGERPCESFQEYNIVGAFIDDLDGDERAELIVGVPTADSRAGVAYVLSGRTGDRIFEYAGAGPEHKFGKDVTGLSDLNGDRVPEFAIITDAQTPGSVVVYNGATGVPLLQSPASRYPASQVRDGGDLDGDTISDIVVGTRKIPSGNAMAGEVFAFSGRTGELLWNNVQADWGFGFNITTGTDFTGDNVPDVLSRRWPDEKIVVISGASGHIVASHIPPSIGNKWGSNMALADVNADGKLDLVGMRLSDGRFGLDVVNPRTARILHWAEGLNPSHWFSYYFGNEMAVADVNGDGSADFVIGSVGSGVQVFGGSPLLLNLVSRITNYDLTRGEPYGFTVGGGTPGRTMHLLGSISGNGCTFIPQLGICIDLDQCIYRLGAAVTDPERVAHFSVQVPLNIPLGPVWLQTVDPADPSRGPITSNVMRLEVVD